MAFNTFSRTKLSDLLSFFDRSIIRLRVSLSELIRLFYIDEPSDERRVLSINPH